MSESRHYTTLSSSELTIIRQVKTLFEVFDKGLQTLLAQAPTPTAATPAHAHERQQLDAFTPRRRSTDLPLAPSPLRHKTPSSYVVYKAKDARTKAPRGLSTRDQEVYAAIQAVREGLSRGALLRKFHATIHTGIVDGAVRRLRVKKLVVADRVAL